MRYETCKKSGFDVIGMAVVAGRVVCPTCGKALKLISPRGATPRLPAHKNEMRSV